MQLSNALLALAAGCLVAAAPLPDLTDLTTRDEGVFWAAVGFANPLCEGPMMFAYQGSSSECINFSQVPGSVMFYWKVFTTYDFSAFPYCNVVATRDVDGDGDGNGNTTATAVPWSVPPEPESADMKAVLAMRDNPAMWNMCIDMTVEAAMSMQITAP